MHVVLLIIVTQVWDFHKTEEFSKGNSSVVEIMTINYFCKKENQNLFKNILHTI